MRLAVRQLARTDYDEALELQARLHRRVMEDPSTEYLILVEHPPVITLGRRASRANVLGDEDTLRREGFALREISRGGDVTYHGPGQLVGYPIIDLNCHGLGIRSYIRALEEALIRALKRFEIEAERVEGLTGVWTGGEKVAAIGVAIRRWVSYHGFALNVNTDLSRFDRIVPCGISDCRVTSMARLTGDRVDEWKVRRVVEEEFRKVFGFEPNATPVSRRFPPWLRKRIVRADAVDDVREMLSDLRLHTVCRSAQCPNLRECFGRDTATFLILGNVCTRRCRFCAVEKGETLPPEPDEPGRVAEAAVRLGLKHVVVTSVTRDDLADGGASHFAATIRAIRARTDATVEVLIPDFAGGEDALRIVLRERPDVLNHNLETVPSLYAKVRPGADYHRSLELLRHAKTFVSSFPPPPGEGRERVSGDDGGASIPACPDMRKHECLRHYGSAASAVPAACSLKPAVLCKSGLMLGLGETIDEVLDVMRDLRRVGCDMLTLGQYLAPSAEHLPVARFVHPDEFDELAARAREMGFLGVASGPFVRSSHDAAALFTQARAGMKSVPRA